MNRPKWFRYFFVLAKISIAKFEIRVSGSKISWNCPFKYLDKLQLVLLAEDFDVVAGPVPGAPAEHEHQVETARLVAPVQPGGLKFVMWC